MQVLEEFYTALQHVGVSAATGEGMDDFFAAAQACADEYDKTYKPDLDKRKKVRNVATIATPVVVRQSSAIIGVETSL